MAQVQTPREFKFVGGPSRKRRRNGTAAAVVTTTISTAPAATAASSKRSKRSCVPTAALSPPSCSSTTSDGTSSIHHPLPSSPLPLYHVNLLSASPRSVFARMPMDDVGDDDDVDDCEGDAIHPDITDTIAATLAGLGSSANGHTNGGHASLSHHTSSPKSRSSSSCESIPINTTASGNNTHNNITGLEGILDWPTEEFMNPFFPAVNLDVAMFGGGGVNNVGVQSTPSMLLPSPSPPQMSSLPPLAPPSQPSQLSSSNSAAAVSVTVSDDVEKLPSHHLDTLSAIQLPSPPSIFCFDMGSSKQLQNQQQQQISIPTDTMLMATSPRMYAQPSILYDTISRIFFQYDQEFCILPLTCDFAANPFRYNMQTMQQSSLLRHCILALSYKHVDYDTGACTSEADAYKRRATQMLQDKLHSEAAREGQPDASLLDASIVMLTLDCATSALGPWASHLRRAKRLLQGTRPTGNASGSKSVSSPTPSNTSTSSSSSASSSSSSSSPPSSSSQRLAQLGLLAWFDVTLALTSRNGCIFPERTILSIFDTPEGSPPSGTSAGQPAAAFDFYAISGCPRELFECMVRLAAYAREMQITSTLSCVRFDMAPVLRIERRIVQWQSPAFDDPVKAQDLLDMVMRGRRPFHARTNSEEGATGDSGVRYRDDSSDAAAAETAAAEKLWRTRNIAVEGQDDGGSVLDYRLDLYHCAEAWRYALLIYIERVFKWQNRKWQAERRRKQNYGDDNEGGEEEEEEEDNERASLLQFLARRTLNHVTSCRRTTFVQKQLMLPVFLAGAEIRDAGLRNDSRDYCVWWGSKTRYNMFITARALLEEVWRHCEGEDLWWGDVFDQNSKRGEKEYLLG